MIKYQSTLFLMMIFTALTVSQAAQAATKEPVVIGLLQAHELETLTPSERAKYLYALQDAFSDAFSSDGPESLDGSVKSVQIPLKRSSGELENQIAKWFFGESAFAQYKRYCIKGGGYILDDPPCQYSQKFEAAFVSRCGPNSIACNPWVYGENVCVPRDGNETVTCGQPGRVKSGEEIARFILQRDPNRAEWNKFVSLLEQHCASGAQVNLCETLTNRMYAVNDALAGRPARAFGAPAPQSQETNWFEVADANPERARQRAALRDQLRAFRPAQAAVQGCDAYQLMDYGILSPYQVKTLVCDTRKTDLPRATYAARVRQIAAKIAQLPSGPGKAEERRNGWLRAKANFEKCIVAFDKVTVVSTVQGRRSRNRICDLGNRKYRVYMRTESEKLYANQLARMTGLSYGERRLPPPEVHEAELGKLLSSNRRDICQMQIDSGACATQDSSGTSYLPDGPAAAAPQGKAR